MMTTVDDVENDDNDGDAKLNNESARPSCPCKEGRTGKIAFLGWCGIRFCNDGLNVRAFTLTKGKSQ